MAERRIVFTTKEHNLLFIHPLFKTLNATQERRSHGHFCVEHTALLIIKTYVIGPPAQFCSHKEILYTFGFQRIS